MRLQNIEIENFRPYREAEVDLTNTEGHIHIIEGPQGAGKTSFHKAVQWCLYGGDGPKTNYKGNWNETARSERDESMSVCIEFEEDRRDHLLERKIRNFNHNQERATEELILIIDGQDRREDDDAQEYIRELLPEQLKDFFFLDGEKIQDLVDDERGVEVKEDIETILKHQAIINAKEDLQSLIKDRYIPKRDRLESEKAKRDELTEKITELRSKKTDLKKKKEDLLEERGTVSDNIDDVKEEIEKHNQEVIEKLNDLDDRIRELENEKQEALTNLKESWENLPIAILSDTIDEVVDEIRSEEEHYESLRSSLKEQEIVENLQREAERGTCPVCGNNHTEELPDLSIESEVDESEVELSSKIHQCRQKKRRLLNAPLPEKSPTEVAQRLQELREKIRKKKNEKEDLYEQVGGQPEEGQKERLEDQLRSLERKQDRIEDELDEVRDEIQDIKDEIESIRKQKRDTKGTEAIDRVEDKIEAARQAIDHLDTIREVHIDQKRDAIKETMNNVFDQVSQSEFIANRYEEVDFRGGAEEEDSYVLKLEKKGDRETDMENRPPSAGETQLMALSFIFGLNEYAKYSTTIVFDTVAGRLDLENSQAQGDFFTSLSEPLILLVTDAEMQKLEPAIEDYIGRRYRIRPDTEMNSTLEVIE